MQIEDKDLTPIVRALQSGIKPSSLEVQCWSPASRHYWLLWDLLALVGGLVVKRFKKQNAVETFYQLLTPQALTATVLRECHDSIISGHFGILSQMSTCTPSHVTSALQTNQRARNPEPLWARLRQGLRSRHP